MAVKLSDTLPVRFLLFLASRRIPTNYPVVRNQEQLKSAPRSVGSLLIKISFLPLVLIGSKCLAFPFCALQSPAC